MITYIQEKNPAAVMMARRDFAKITKVKIIEPPYWFIDDQSGLSYRNMYAGIGWPQQMSDRDDQRSGYACIVAVIKDDLPVEDSRLLVLDEVEDQSIEILLKRAIEMRQRWGFGLRKSLLRVFLGDFRQFELVVAEYNGRQIEIDNNDRNVMIVSPPDDYDNTQFFDICMRRMQSVLSEDSKRLSLGNNEIVRNRILAFKRGDPAIAALGGLIHSLLIRQPWLELTVPSVFDIDI